jgi:hypothetical protein
MPPERRAWEPDLLQNGKLFLDQPLRNIWQI